MSSTAVHSNAFNFKSHFDHGVDPRTGLYTMSLSVPELKCNALAGPTFPLAITFNPMNTVDEGFGVGWSMNLTEYRPRDRQLSLSSGESFTVTGSGERPGIEERKLDSFHLHDDGGGQFTVVHRDGRVEVLRSGGSGQDVRALPVTVMSPEGRRLEIEYAPFLDGQRLSSVREHSGHVLLEVLRKDNSEVELKFFPESGPDGTPLARYLLTLNGDGWVTKLTLPTEEQACWRLGYEIHNDYVHLTEVRSPTGSHEEVSYFTGGDEGHRFPGDFMLPLPRVTKHLLDPGYGQPPMETRYAYRSERSHPNGNFLGLGGVEGYPDDGRDNLYRASPDFLYGTTLELWADGRRQRRVERTFNRFHLQVEEVTIQDNCRTRVSTVHYADHPDHRNKPFDEQPPQCQLPMTRTTRWELTDDATQVREEVEHTRFDDYGNLIERITPEGVREVNTYYPATGDGDSCPPDPEGFVRSLHTQTRYPAASEYGNAPTLRSTRTYAAVAALDGAHAALFLLESTDVQTQVDAGDTERRRATRTWYDDPADTLRLGRAHSTLETMNGLTTTTTHAYRAFTNARLCADVLEITETVTGFDGTEQTVVEEHSALNGHSLHVQTAAGAIIEYAYDALARVTRETVAPDTPFEASRHYTYHLVSEDGGSDDQSWQEVTDAKQVKTRSWFDGMSRAIMEETQDVEAAAARGLPPGDAPFRTIYRAQHDSFDQLESETYIDWHNDKDLALTSHYGYDNWGERNRTTTPDGVCAVSERSPFGELGATQRDWLESASTPPACSNVVVSWLNPSGKALKESWLDANGAAVFSVTRQFDGLDHCVASRDDLGDNQERLTRFDYDVWGRMVATTLPDGTLMERSYAPHTVDTLPVRIQVTDVEAELPTVVVGEQTFDGLSRLATRTVGGRKEQYFYEGGHLQVQKRITPAGNTIDYTYERNLGEDPQTILSRDDAAQFDYDPQTGAVTGARNDAGTQVYDYAANGRLIAERRLRGTQTLHASHFTTSRLGLQLQRLDTSPKGGGVDTQSFYNSKGQLIRTTQGSLVARFQYDTFGRLYRTTTDNPTTSERVVTRQAYDGFGRETKRISDIAGKSLEQSQEWRADDQIERRVQTLDGVVQLDETFTYDLRGRLEIQECEGESLPVDRHGNAISTQIFVYDALNNPRMSTTRFASGDLDRAAYTYSTDDPCQLVKVVHSHDDYALEEYRYDADGNLLNDEQGRTLRYDALGRLLDVTAGGAAGTVLGSYRYDGHDHLTSLFDAAGNEVHRFYEGYRLHHEISAAATLHYLHVDDTPLGEHQADQPRSARLLLASAIGTVVAELYEHQLRQHVYSVYGECSDLDGTRLGYNGERPEDTGCYLLGQGYRAYNPVLMRFHSPDWLSPFDEGGINTYMYCHGNPVLFRDPTGHYQEGPDPVVRPPEPEQPGPGGFWAWAGIALTVVFAAVSLYAVPWTGGMSIPLVMGAVGGLAQIAGAGLQVTGIVTANNSLYTAGMYTAAAGLGVSLAPGVFSAAKAAPAFIKKHYHRGVSMAGRVVARLAGKGAGAMRRSGALAPAAAAPVPSSLAVRTMNAMAQWGGTAGSGASSVSSMSLGAGAGGGGGGRTVAPPPKTGLSQPAAPPRAPAPPTPQPPPEVRKLVFENPRVVTPEKVDMSLFDNEVFRSQQGRNAPHLASRRKSQ